MKKKGLKVFIVVVLVFLANLVLQSGVLAKWRDENQYKEDKRRSPRPIEKFHMVNEDGGAWKYVTDPQHQQYQQSYYYGKPKRVKEVDEEKKEEKEEYYKFSDGNLMYFKQNSLAAILFCMYDDNTNNIPLIDGKEVSKEVTLQYFFLTRNGMLKEEIEEGSIVNDNINKEMDEKYLNFIKELGAYKRKSYTPEMISEAWKHAVNVCVMVKEENDALYNDNEDGGFKKSHVEIPNECNVKETIKLNLNRKRYFYIDKSGSSTEAEALVDKDDYNGIVQCVDGDGTAIPQFAQLPNIMITADNPFKEKKGDNENDWNVEMKDLSDKIRKSIIDNHEAEKIEEKINGIGALTGDSKFKVTLVGDEADKIEVKNDWNKDGLKNESYDITVGEDFSKSFFYVIIPYRYRVYMGRYDIWSGEEGTREIIYPEERGGLLEYYRVIKVNVHANVSINQYIDSVGGQKVEYLKKKESDGNWQYKNDNKDVGARKDWSEKKKKEQPAVLENGAPIVYKVEITNEQKEDVFVKFNDTLPSCFVGQKVEIKKGSETETIEKLPEDGVIKNSQWPGGIKKEYKEGNEYYTRVKGKNTVTFTITTKVYANTNAKYYKPDSPLQAKAEITTVKMKAEKAAPTFTPKKEKSSDYFTLKKYNVSINSYISAVNRTNGGDLQSGEYVVEDGKYGLGKRKEKNNEERKDYPIFVENGDIVTYTMEVTNGAKDDGPYYNPKEVTINLTDLLPTDTCEIKESTLGYTQEEKKVIFDSFKLTNEETRIITLKVLINTNPHKIYKNEVIHKNETEIVNITNCYGMQSKEKEIKNEGSPKSSCDYFRTKDYNIAIDKYIQKVEHKHSREGTQITYNSEARRFNEEAKDAPVSVEYGDIVTYTIRIYNTTASEKYNEYNIGDRRKEPYRRPQYIYVDITDTLPDKCSVVSSDYTYTENKQAIKFNNVRVEKDNVAEITVSLIVEEDEKWKKEANTVKIDNVRNLNGYAVKNHGTRITAVDIYEVNDYDVSLEEYISAYNAEMAKYNNGNGFTNGESQGFNDKTESYSNNNPLEVEKYETLTITTKVKNNAEVGTGIDEHKNTETENNFSGNGKYPTRVRPTVEIATESGLNRTGFRAEWYNADGTLKKDITENITVSGNNFTITDDNIILSPGEYILYVTDVKVMESNLCLDNIGVSSKITKLTNINKDDKDERVVTEQNIAEQTTNADYVRLKDLVVAGTVWEDTNRDGIKNEAGKKDVVIKLYRIGQINPVATTTTNENGFYTFGRVAKAEKDENKNYRGNHYEYYVEFEYDGVTYKATEVYGGDKDGDADGMNNLEGRQGSSTWRQGYSDLPDTKSGDESYKTDSNAYEFDNVRNGFDSEYQTIGFNKSYKGTDSNMDLTYSKSGHKSQLIENPNRVMRARSFIKQNYDSEVVESSDNTNSLFLVGHSEHGESPETEYLKFINLGLVKREQVDISIESDVHSVKTTINGEEMTYDYYKNDANSTLENYNLQLNAYKLNQAYHLNLYQADYNYRNGTYYTGEGNYEVNKITDYKKEESELAAEVIYRIKIHNNEITEDNEKTTKVENIPVETAINEMAIYYNKNFVEDWDTEKTVRVKNRDTGLFEDRTVKAIRVNYGTEEQLDGLINNTENVNSKTGVTISKASSYGNTKRSDMSSEYNVLYLNIPEKNENYIKEGDTKYIQITFTVDKDTARSLKLTQEDMGFEMVSEVSAYTTKYSENYTHSGLAGKYAGLVDRDSNPGNLQLNGVENYDNYEDDKYKVGITIDTFKNPPDNPPDNPTPGKRSVTGVVWEDARSEGVGTEQTGVQYMGNGEYKASDENDEKANINPYNKLTNDKPVAGVKVSLIEVVQTENGKYYEYPAKDSNGMLIETVTGTDGKYVLTDFIPGYYKVRFDYGYDETRKDNIMYNGQDYKSTKYYNESLYYEDSQGYKTDNIGSQNNFDYFDKVKEALRGANRSDAQDDEIRRLNVNSYSETMTMTEAKLFYDVKEIANDLTGRKADAQKLTKNTHMYAESAIFYVKPEEVDSSDKEIDASESDFDKTRLWNIKDLDFGLEYRPEASIILDKDLSTVELVTSDNKTLIKLYFEKDANGELKINQEKSKGYQNVQFLPNEEKLNQGFAYINMDTKILEGCTIKVEYQMDANNESEVDRVNKNLHEIRYEIRAADRNYIGVFYSNNYNANGTAAEALSQQYYEKKNNQSYYDEKNGKEVYSYLKKIKKPYKATGKTPIGTVILTGTEYYGTYLGQTYYTGKVGDNDIVAQLKVDHILDYIDNDFTFNLSENNTKNKLWQTTTSKELKAKNILDFSKVYVDNDNDLNLVDKNGIRYDTENRSNLALSVDDNKNGIYSRNDIDGEDRNGNVSLSRFLTTNKESKQAEKYRGYIRAMASKVLSAGDVTQGTGLSYENMAEVVQYTSITGRRTKLPEGEGGGVIGNANAKEIFGNKDPEDDTDATEVITITPPTGMAQ